MQVIRAWKADENRSITLETGEGRYVPVEEVVATDEALGFALLRTASPLRAALQAAQSPPARGDQLFVVRSGTNDRPPSFFRLAALGTDREGTYLATRPAPGARHLGSPVLNERGEVVGMVSTLPTNRKSAPGVLLIARVARAGTVGGPPPDKPLDAARQGRL